MAGFYEFPNGEHYFGFKKALGKSCCYGWIQVESFGSNGMKVKEIAINKTANKPIRCGQKKLMTLSSVAPDTLQK